MIALLCFLTTAFAADAGEVRLGIEAGIVKDLPDATSGDSTRFGVGPTLAVPLLVHVAPNARLRAAVSAQMATGSDRVFWSVPVDGQTVELYDDDHWAMAAVGSGTLGMEVLLPLNTDIEVAFGGDVGVSWVGTYHSFSGNTRQLIDPDQNDLDDPNNVDPYTSQVAWRTGVDASVAVPVSERLHLTLRTGYSVAFVNTRPLQKSPAALDAQRAAYGWNPLSVTVGITRRW